MLTLAVISLNHAPVIVTFCVTSALVEVLIVLRRGPLALSKFIVDPVIDKLTPTASLVPSTP